jgi:Zn-dependent protease/CBS domain-containing protein
MKWSFPILRLFGIELRLHATFLLLLFWVGLAEGAEGGWSHAWTGILIILLIFTCVVLHELGHALTARIFGIRTPDITLLPIGGVAHLERIPERPFEELIVALAGPGVSGALALFLWVVSGFASPEPLRAATQSEASSSLLAQLVSVNLGLLLFNLLPAFPMDGGRILRAALTRRLGRVRATEVASRIGQSLAVVLLGCGILLPAPLLILIALFVFLSARSEAAQVSLRSASAELRVADLMITQFEVLDPEQTLGEAVHRLRHSAQKDLPLVSRDGRLFGLVTYPALVEGLQRSGLNAPLGVLAQVDVPRLSPGDTLPQAIEALQECPFRVLPVVESSGRLVGLVSLEKIGEALLLQKAQRSSG